MASSSQISVLTQDMIFQGKFERSVKFYVFFAFNPNFNRACSDKKAHSFCFQISTLAQKTPFLSSVFVRYK